MAAEKWSAEEIETLRREYPKGARAAVLSALPNREWPHIVKRAYLVGVRRENRELQPEARQRLIDRNRNNHPRLGKVVSPVIEREGIPGKACVNCLAWKPLEKFSRHATCAGGRRSICTTCEGRVAYATHREAKIAAVRRYQLAHPEETAETKRASNRRRHGKKVAGSGVTAEQWREIRAAFEFRCAYCGDPATTLDHVIPLSRGGEHSPSNVVPACRDCNFAKHDKLPDEWQAPTSRKD